LRAAGVGARRSRLPTVAAAAFNAAKVAGSLALARELGGPVGPHYKRVLT